MKLLLVEDDRQLAAQLSRALRSAGYAVDHATDGERAEFLGATESYDAVILDLGLPRLDGIAVIERWRASGRGVPVLILTARDAWSDKIAGFKAGADDYVVKPFRMDEVLARIAALIRRAAGHAAGVIRCGALALDTHSGVITQDSTRLELTAYEWRILAYLMHHPGRIVSRAELTEHVYAQGFDRDSNTVEVLVSRLRRKIGSGAIETVRGLGYRLATQRDGA